MMNKLAGKLDQKGNPQLSVMFLSQGLPTFFMTVRTAVSNDDVSAGRLIRDELVHN